MARPKFEDLSPADERELSGNQPRRPDAPAAPLTEPPVTGSIAQPADAPDVRIQPPDSPPLADFSGKDSKNPVELVSLNDAFDAADKKAALEAAKSPEEKAEEARVAAEEEAAKKAEADKGTGGGDAPAKSETDQTITDVEAELANPHLKARDRKRYKELLSSLKSEKTRASEYEAKVKELEAKAATGATVTTADTDEVKKLREEASRASTLADENLKFKRRFGLETDPELAKRFDEPSKRAEEGIAKTLTGYQLGEPTLKLIEKEGGFAAFSRSNKVFHVSAEVDDPENPGQKKIGKIARTASELTRDWLNGMAPADAETVRELMREQVRAGRDKETYVASETEKAKEYFAQQSQAGAKQTEAQQADAKAIADKYAAWVTETGTKTDWLKEQTVDVKATPEQKKVAEEHNKFVGEVKAFLKEPVKTVEDFQKMAYDAAEARHLRRAGPATAARIKELEAQVARLQSATATTPRKGSLLPGGSNSAPDKPKKFDPMRDDPTEKLIADFAAQR